MHMNSSKVPPEPKGASYPGYQDTALSAARLFGTMHLNLNHKIFVHVGLKHSSACLGESFGVHA